MNAYVYNGDLWCEQCGEAIRHTLAGKGKAPASPDDETTYDSDDYPKGPYPNGGGEADCPKRCASGMVCANAYTLSSGQKIGAHLGNALTADGVEYVRKAIGQGGAMAHLWASLYPGTIDTTGAMFAICQEVASWPEENFSGCEIGQAIRDARAVITRIQPATTSPKGEHAMLIYDVWYPGVDCDFDTTLPDRVAVGSVAVCKNGEREYLLYGVGGWQKITEDEGCRRIAGLCHPRKTIKANKP